MGFNHPHDPAHRIYANLNPGLVIESRWLQPALHAAIASFEYIQSDSQSSRAYIYDVPRVTHLT